MSDTPHDPASGGPPPDDVDRRFREIVAGLMGPTADPGVDDEPAGDADEPREPVPGPDPGPAAGSSTAPGQGGDETDDSAEPTTIPFDARGYAVPPAGVAGVPGRWRGSEGQDASGDDHFVPDPPPPLPAGDLHFWAILVGLTVGPLLLVLSYVLPLLDETWGWVGIAMAVAGFVLLVLRQPRDHRDDDWGAQV